MPKDIHHPKTEQNNQTVQQSTLSPWKKLRKWVDGDPMGPVEIPEPGCVAAEDLQRKPVSELHKLKRFRKLYIVASIVFCCLLIGLLLYTVSDLPAFGVPDAPTNNEVSQKYIEDGLTDTGAANIIAGMILDYRAFDTLGESTVLFIAVSAVIILLRKDPDALDPEEEGRLRREEMLAKSHPNIILRTVAAILVPFILLFGAYVVLNGHISPGGGFSGGAIMGAALILYASAYGFKKMDTFFTFKTFTGITSSALLVYACSKAYSFFTGANHLESYIPKGIPGAILSGGLILPLNICVGMIVACTMYGFYSLFSRGDI
ncbi:MAG: MnhB domain-containing protein [Oscillospiraceae bacterium]|nr:MnhB domain-containing protein [Oscillospiraceae bacterium]